MTSSRLALSGLGPNPSTDEIDAVVHDLIDEHFAGNLTEEQTRREISSALYASRIHEEVARTASVSTQQQRNDLAESLLTLITKQVMVASDKASAFDLEKVRHASVCGAIRQFMKKALPSEMRNHRRATNRNGTPLDPGGYEFTVLGQTAASLIVWDEDSARVDGTNSDLVDEFVDLTKGMRGTDRMLANAEVLCLSMGTAAAVRPDAMADRDAIHKALLADETLAHRSLRQWYDLVCGENNVEPSARVEDRVLALWDDQDESMAEALLRRPREVAHALALAAVTPLPRPAKKALSRFKSIVSGTAPKRTAPWRDLTSALCDAYVASQYEAVSQYATMSTDAREAAAVGHQIARNRLDDLLALAAVHPGTPLGKSANMVLARLIALAEETLVEDAADNTLRARMEAAS